MTTPLGDQPDWQTLVTPQVVPKSIFNQQGGVNGTLFSSATPFRVWGIWISSSFSSNASFVAALQNVFTEIQDGFGNVLLAVVNTIRVANSVNVQALSLALPGVTPQVSGNFTVNLVSGASPANTDYRVNGGIYVSQP